MRYSQNFSALAASLLLVLGGCGSGGETSEAGSDESPPSSPSPSAEAAGPTGTLTTKAIDCATIKPPADLKKASTGPDVMCAFESGTDYVSFAAGASPSALHVASTFDQAKKIEKANSNGKIVIEPVEAAGWTFGARWPDEGTFVRVQRWLVDGQGQVLLCKMGSDRGESAITELADVCEQAKTALYTE